MIRAISRICSPFGGIPRNWKHGIVTSEQLYNAIVPPSGGSLEIGNFFYPLEGRFAMYMFPLRGDP